jgi:hypothetical protein
VVAKLKKSYPAVEWNEKSATIADVDCDGNADTIISGTEKDRVAVAVVPGTRDDKPGVSFFPRSSHTQDGFCAVPIRIELSPLDCDSPVGPPQGCKPNKSCKAFSVVDDECSIQLLLGIPLASRSGGGGIRTLPTAGEDYRSRGEDVEMLIRFIETSERGVIK